MLKPLRLALVMIAGLLAACSAPSAAPPTAAAPTALPTAVRPDLPEFGVFDPASVTEIDLGALPVIPDISANAIAPSVPGLMGIHFHALDAVLLKRGSTTAILSLPS